jgi:hypothetical protein
MVLQIIPWEDKFHCDSANHSSPDPLKDLKKMSIRPTAIGVSLADEDIKSGKMIHRCESSIWKSVTKTWIGPPNAMRVAENWEVEDGRAKFHDEPHKLCIDEESPGPDCVAAIQSIDDKQGKENNCDKHHLVVRAERIRLARFIRSDS